MADCIDCLHFDICQFNEQEQAVINLKSSYRDISNVIADGCKFFKNKADFVEVKHGEWLPDYETFVDEWERESEPVQTGWVCSLCGRQEWKKEPYCHCGADMRKEGVD